MYFALVEIFPYGLTSIKMKVIKNYLGKNILSILMYISLFLKKKDKCRKSHAVLLSKGLRSELIFNRKLVMGGLPIINNYYMLMRKIHNGNNIIIVSMFITK